MTNFLELLCQLVLAYQSYKALKSAPAPRKRRKANEDGRSTSVYAETLRRRRIKALAKAWVVLSCAGKVEGVLETIFAWWLPLYTTFRFIAYMAFLFYHLPLAEIAYSNFVVPALRPHEKRMNACIAVLDDVADIASWLLSTAVSALWQTLLKILAPFMRLWQILIWPVRLIFESKTSAVEDVLDAAEAVAHDEKTPRRSKRTGKPRYSQVATPHVPGHLIAEDAAHPPVQPRLDPAERSLDDLPAFQEALDRAQAAFYEASSPQREASGLREEGPALNELKKREPLLADRPSQRGRRRKVAETAIEIEEEESPKKRKVQVMTTPVDEDAADSSQRSVRGKGASRAASTGISIRQNGRNALHTAGVKGSRLPQPSMSTMAVPVDLGAGGPVGEPAITRSSQRAREGALAARKRAREDALARKVIASQVDSRIAKRKKAL